MRPTVVIYVVFYVIVPLILWYALGSIMGSL